MSEDRAPYDPLGMTAKMDQLAMAVVDMARGIAAYRAALLAQGIPEREVVVLVRDWHWSVITQGTRDRRDRP